MFGSPSPTNLGTGNMHQFKLVGLSEAYQENSWRTVTVEMPVTQHPPYRSQRALLTHWAPPSGSGVKADRRMRMQ